MDDDDYDALPPLPSRLPPFTVGHEQFDDYEEAPPPLPRKAWKPTLRRPADRVLKFDRAAETEIDSVDDLSRATRSQSTSTTDLPSIEVSVPRSTLYLSQSTSTTDLAKDENEFGFNAEPTASVIDMTPTFSFADAAAEPVAATAITLPAMYMSTDFTAPPPASDVSSALPSSEAPSRTVELYTDMQLGDSTERHIVVEQPAMAQAQEPEIVMSQSFPDSSTDDDIVIDLPPSKRTPRGSSNRPEWSSRRSSRSSGSKTPRPAADTDAIFNGSYIEMFTIGGGTRWFYALLDFIMAILVFMKHVGFPGGGQIVDAYYELLELPIAGALLKFCFGASARHAYKISGAYKHPELELYWKARPSFCQRVCQNIKNPDPPYNTPFPAVEYNSRGTPEHLPFTDFENAISANERGALWDSIFNGGARGFKARFKTGTRHQKGTTLFDVRREPAASLASICCFGMMSVACYFTCAHKCCQTCCKCQAKAKEYVTVYDPDGSIVGSVRQSKQMSFCTKLFRNRFNKTAKPVYDILDTTGKIIYTIFVPITKYKFMFCCCDAYADEDYLAVCPGPLDEATDRYRGTDNRDINGWMVALTPKYARLVDACLSRCKLIALCCTLLSCGSTVCTDAMKMVDSFVSLLRTCPIDHLSQVPHPGRENLRCTTPCSHGMSAMRTAFPAGATERDRKLLIAAGIQIDMESFFHTL